MTVQVLCKQVDGRPHERDDVRCFLGRQIFCNFFDIAQEVRSILHEGNHAGPVLAVYEHANGVAGQLEHLLDAGHRADVIKVVDGGKVGIRILLGR